MTHVPDGWQLVPKEPTDEMNKEGRATLPLDSCEADAEDVYVSMLAAAPTPPASGEGDMLREELLAAAERAKANEAHVGKQVRAMVRGHDMPGVDYVGLCEALAQYEALFRKAAAAQSPSLAEEMGRLREALNGTLGLIRKAQERLCSYLADGEFQSDKYPTTPRGKVPLSVKDPTAQDLLWQYAQRRREVDAEFSDDLEQALKIAGYKPPPDDDYPDCEGCSTHITAGMKYTVTLDGCHLCEECAPSYQDTVDYWREFPPNADDDEQVEAAAGSTKALEAHIAAGGSPDDKPLWVME